MDVRGLGGVHEGGPAEGVEHRPPRGVERAAHALEVRAHREARLRVAVVHLQEVHAPVRERLPAGCDRFRSKLIVRRERVFVHSSVLAFLPM